jgi:hypothetical protein
MSESIVHVINSSAQESLNCTGLSPWVYGSISWTQTFLISLFRQICHSKSVLEKKEEGKLEVEACLTFLALPNSSGCILWHSRCHVNKSVQGKEGFYMAVLKSLSKEKRNNRIG